MADLKSVFQKKNRIFKTNDMFIKRSVDASEHFVEIACSRCP